MDETETNPLWETFESYARTQGVTEAVRQLGSILVGYVQTVNSEVSTLEFEGEGLVTIKNYRVNEKGASSGR